jgi:hypothetical protein
MKRIKLTQGKYALVDDKDFSWLNKMKWHYMNSGYAGTENYIGKINGKYTYKHLLMHRLINDTPEFIKGNRVETDHINRDKLDNRRCNLRTTTCRENNLNKALYKNNTTGYKHIRWDDKRKKFIVQISFNGINRCFNFM